MNSIIKILLLLVTSAFIASCSNYGYISENDVYMQAPTEINLDENENDITSFNAFKARQKGAFSEEYKDPRANETMRFNQFMIMGAYMPYGYGYGHGMYINRPIAFHGMGMYNPYYSHGFYTGYGMGLHAMYGNGFYSPYGFYPPYGHYNPYGFGHYPFYYGGGYYGSGYYGSPYGGVVNSQNNPSQNQTSYYGQRQSLTSSSNRSSYYSNTKSFSPQNASASYDMNDQTSGSSRRDVKRSNAGASDYNKNFTKNGVPINNGMKYGGTNAQNSINPVHNRAVSNSYVPNSSARRSGVVQQSRSTVQPNRGGAFSTPSNTRNNSHRIQTTPPNHSTPRMSSPQRSSSPNIAPSGASPRGTSPSSTPSSGSRRR